MDKVQFRQHFRRVLLGMDPKQRAEKSRLICERVIASEAFRDAEVVMCYLSLPYEVDTAEMILKAWQMGKSVAVPKISWQQRHMIPVEIKTLETGFSTEIGGLRNPTQGTPVPFDQIDLVVTPGMGFDECGNRLGKGGSYYDRFFKTKGLEAVKCGFAFSEQMVEEVPTEDWDVPLDMIVTEEAVINCNIEQSQ